VEPTIALWRFAVPFAIAAAAALVVARRAPRRDARWTWLAIAAGVVVAWPPGLGVFDGFPLRATEAIPSLFAILAILAMVPFGRFLVPVAGALAVLVLYPWASWGAWKWTVCVVAIAVVPVLALAAGRAIQGRHWAGVWLWGWTLAAAAAVLISHASSAFMEIGLSFAAAVAGAVLLGPLRGNRFLAGGAMALPATITVWLLAIGHASYAPDPDAPGWEVPVLAATALVIALAPLPWWAIERRCRCGPALWVGMGLAALLAAAAAGTALSVYLSDAEGEEDEGPAWQDQYYGGVGDPDKRLQGASGNPAAQGNRP